MHTNERRRCADADARRATHTYSERIRGAPHNKLLRGGAHWIATARACVARRLLHTRRGVGGHGARTHRAEWRADDDDRRTDDEEAPRVGLEAAVHPERAVAHRDECIDGHEHDGGRRRRLLREAEEQREHSERADVDPAARHGGEDAADKARDEQRERLGFGEVAQRREERGTTARGGLCVTDAGWRSTTATTGARPGGSLERKNTAARRETTRIQNPRGTPRPSGRARGRAFQLRTQASSGYCAASTRSAARQIFGRCGGSTTRYTFDTTIDRSKRVGRDEMRRGGGTGARW